VEAHFYALGCAVLQVLERIRKDDIKFIRLQFSDIQGIPKYIAIPVNLAENTLTEALDLMVHRSPVLRG
jgi:glutamine synthetase